MVTINILKISADRTTIDVSITTNSDDTFTDVNFWTDKTFKDYSLAIDLSAKLTGLTENEVFSITAEEVGLSSFDGIYFLEITSTDVTPEACAECVNPLLAVVADLSAYREVLLDRVLKLNNNCSQLFTGDICSDSAANNVLNLQMLLDSVMAALQFGYYTQALSLFSSLDKLVDIDTCDTCGELTYSTFKLGLNYSILNNTLILN